MFTKKHHVTYTLTVLKYKKNTKIKLHCRHGTTRAKYSCELLIRELSFTKSTFQLFSLTYTQDVGTFHGNIASTPQNVKIKQTLYMIAKVQFLTFIYKKTKMAFLESSSNLIRYNAALETAI